MCYNLIDLYPCIDNKIIHGSHYIRHFDVSIVTELYQSIPSFTMAISPIYLSCFEVAPHALSHWYHHQAVAAFLPAVMFPSTLFSVTSEPSLKPWPTVNVAYNRSPQVQHGTHIMLVTTCQMPHVWYSDTHIYSPTMDYLSGQSIIRVFLI